jgi:8-oxo-dGTP pyrophosphatase MutT (NUDIX family)
MNFDFSSVSKAQLFINQLKAELLSSLPGVEAHLRLAPGIRIDDLKAGNHPEHALESAVLIILYPFQNSLYTAVILRNEYDGAHSGQISLPGGKKEDVDIDFKQTALREAEEEIGIVPADLEIIGQLTRFYVKPSNFIIYPFIAFQNHRPVFHPDRIEVQKVIEIDLLNEISQDRIINKTLVFKNNRQINAPGFLLGGDFMWGATAMIFSELMQILNIVMEKLEKNRG